MVKFDLFMRCDPDELAQRIAYYESLNKERQLDFIIFDYYSARLDNENFDRKKVYETKRAEYEKGRQLREYEHRLELAENSDARAKQNEWHREERTRSDAAYRERRAMYARDSYWHFRDLYFNHWLYASP